MMTELYAALGLTARCCRALCFQWDLDLMESWTRDRILGTADSPPVADRRNREHYLLLDDGWHMVVQYVDGQWTPKFAPTKNTSTLNKELFQQWTVRTILAPAGLHVPDEHWSTACP
jgi:hypothetical protein